MHVCILCPFSCVRLFEVLRTVAPRAPLSVGFSRQEYRSGLPCPPPGGLPDPGITPRSLALLALAGGFFTTSASWEAPWLNISNESHHSPQRCAPSELSIPADHVFTRWMTQTESHQCVTTGCSPSLHGQEITQSY